MTDEEARKLKDEDPDCGVCHGVKATAGVLEREGKRYPVCPRCWDLYSGGFIPDERRRW